MKKILATVVSVLLISGSVKAASTYMGKPVQPVSLTSVPLPTGAATSANQTTTNSSLSSIDGKITAVNTDAVTISAPLPAGANILGKTGIDQTTPGTTNKVSIGTDGTVAINAAIPAGANAIGKLAPNSGVDIGDVTIDNASGAAAVNIQDGGNSITVDGTVSVTGVATAANQTTGNSSLSSIDGKLATLGQKAMTGSVPVVLASDQAAIPVTPQLVTSANVTKASVTVGTSSLQLLGAQPTRTGVECVSLCTNTDYAFLNINSASDAAVTDHPMSPCSSWTPPPGMIPVGAIQVIAASGAQTVRCVSYTP